MNTLGLCPRHSFMLPFLGCDGVYHYYMSTLKTIGEVLLVLDVFLMYTVTYIHIVLLGERRNIYRSMMPKFRGNSPSTSVVVRFPSLVEELRRKKEQGAKRSAYTL
jgi:hypothetical protein